MTRVGEKERVVARIYSFFHFSCFSWCLGPLFFALISRDQTTQSNLMSS